MREKNNDPKWLGQKFGRLTVVGFRKIPNGNYSAWGWDCKCDCGNMLYGARPRSLRHGTTASCGCLKEEQNMHNLGEKRTTHGKTNTRLYGIWCHIKNDAIILILRLIKIMVQEVFLFVMSGATIFNPFIS